MDKIINVDHFIDDIRQKTIVLCTEIEEGINELREADRYEDAINCISVISKGIFSCLISVMNDSENTIQTEFMTQALTILDSFYTAFRSNQITFFHENKHLKEQGITVNPVIKCAGGENEGV